MKTFDQIYEELQNLNNSELNEAWEKAKREKEKSNKIAVTICLVLDVFFLIRLLKRFL